MAVAVRLGTRPLSTSTSECCTYLPWRVSLTPLRTCDAVSRGSNRNRVTPSRQLSLFALRCQDMNEPFHHKKSLGQHFLNSDIVPEWMCDAAAVTSGDTVVEIGPGTGALTTALLARGAVVHAIETDMRAIAVLEDTLAEVIAEKRLTLHQLDARRLSLTELGFLDHQFKIVSNIPYYLTGQLLRRCIEHPVQPSDLVFLVQKEVAKRAAAKLPPAPGAKGSLLALSLQAYGDVSIFKAVSRGHFTPAPEVDSAILAVRNISRDYFTDMSEATFFQAIRAGFANKRKQLQHNFKQTFGSACTGAVFQSADLPATFRDEDISLNEWQRIAATIESCQ